MSGTGLPSQASRVNTALGSNDLATDRDRFATDELAIVLSHFDLGVIEALQEFNRGSRRSPKLVLRTNKGLFLLKRRAKGKDEPFRVAFCHELQRYLMQQKFPLPRLISPKDDTNTMLQWKGGTYEMFEYIKGTSYDNSLEATYDAGRVLAMFHQVVREYEPEYEPPRVAYHAARSVQTSMGNIPATLAKVDPSSLEQSDAVQDVVRFLHRSYNEAALRANETGLPDWPMQIVHSDWHPGNMLFRGPKVISVIDYDSARLQQRVVDAANGALQFSIIGGGDDAAQWPDYMDESRFKRFLRGYDSVSVLSKAELRTIPWLMIEALIAESVIPIAATGSFAWMDGFGFLEMIQRKVKWLRAHTEQLANAL